MVTQILDFGFWILHYGCMFLYVTGENAIDLSQIITTIPMSL
jgi:hypothetical protein